VITDLRTAEMIKYASNAFLATKISFINEIADVCESLGADVKEVAAGMGFDERIGKQFLAAGLGYGGSCFPKDVKALAFMAEEMGHTPRILNSVIEVNANRRDMIIERLEDMLGGLGGKTIGLLGLAFKANTDDMREAPSLDVADKLTAAGAAVKGYDPVAMEVAAPLLPQVTMVKDAYELAEGSDAVVVITEWNEFINLDLERVRDSMNSPVLLDGRNIYQPEAMRELGFTYHGVGRGFNGNSNIQTEIKVRPNVA
jgi:UDPglucose 6-dehydrogenase